MPQAKPKPTVRPRSFIGWASPAGYSELVMDRRVVVYNAEYATNGKLHPVLVTYINPEDVQVLQAQRDRMNAQQRANADARASKPKSRRKAGTGFPVGKHNSAPSRARTPK